MRTKQTKIVATISDLNCSVELIKELYENGMDVVRLNTAHQTQEDTLRVINNVRQVSDKIGILLDTKGPEIRTVNISSTLNVIKGQTVRVASRTDIEADIYVTHANFINEVCEGETILIDDGSVGVLIKEKKNDLAICEVLNKGKIANKKSINVPDCHFSLPAVTEKDKAYIEFAVENNIDFIAHSFVRSKDDVQEIQDILDAKGGQNKIIAKIENQKGVDNIDEILEVAYGVMVARGDLGIEIAAQDVPEAQKKLITKCMERAKPVITATQLLHSMIENPRPTRAEVSDVANAIYDGTDALMLSGETTYGKYPAESVKMMTDIALSVEEGKSFNNNLPTFKSKDQSRNYLAKAAVKASYELPVKAIVIDSQTGLSPRIVSSYRGETPIYAMVHDKRVARELSLSYGIYTTYMELPETTDELVCKAVSSLLKSGAFVEEDTILILAGTPGQNAGANFLEINKAGLCISSKEDVC